MDISILPHDLHHHIQSFLHVISWRAELHFFKLLAFLQSRTFQNIPLHLQHRLKEEDDYYVYAPPMAQHHFLRIYKWNRVHLESVKQHLVQLHKQPLQEYLTQYRETRIRESWNLHTQFMLFGVPVYGGMDKYLYKDLLIQQGEREGVERGWYGCVPFYEYKEMCMKRMNTL